MTKINLEGLKIKGAEKLPIESLLNANGRILQLQPVVAITKPAPGRGVKETLEAVSFIAAIANMVFSLIAKGWTGLGWITIVWNIIPLVSKAIPAVQGLNDVPQELDDLSPEEKEEVLEALKKHLLFSDDVEAVVDVALDIIYRVKTLIGVFK